MNNPAQQEALGDCVEWEKYRNQAGYGHRYHKGKVRYAHRVAYVEAEGVDIEEIAGLVVRHKCDNPGCVNPDHLEIGTTADNMRDRDARGRGRVARGESHGNAKLTEAQVSEIRARYSPRSKTDGATALSREYGVSFQQISRVAHGSAWK